MYLWIATAISLAVHEVTSRDHVSNACKMDMEMCQWASNAQIVSCMTEQQVEQLPFAGTQAGHALAAAAEGIGIQHMAAFVIFLLPGAYVALDTDTLSILSPLRTLRVLYPCS